MQMQKNLLAEAFFGPEPVPTHAEYEPERPLEAKTGSRSPRTVSGKPYAWIVNDSDPGEKLVHVLSSERQKVASISLKELPDGTFLIQVFNAAPEVVVTHRLTAVN